MFGYAGQILKVDLETGKVVKEPLKDELVKGYIGGLGASAKILFESLPPMTEPYSPENVVIFATGPAQGTLIPGSGRGLFVSKSPLTNRIFNSNVGGYIAAELKFAGYDLLAITGRSSKPAYIAIDGDNVEIKPATSMWGKTTYETQAMIKEELGDKSFQVACIGPAGENLVKYSAIIHNLHAAGRGGIASILGWKRLKAIAVRGDKSIEVPDKDALIAFYKEIREKCSKHPTLPGYGTTVALGTINKLGCLGTRNWQTEVFEKAANIDGYTTIPKYKRLDIACTGCPMGCGKVQEVAEGKYAGALAKGPEYETLYALGSLVGVGDFDALVSAARLCDEYGLDTISTGVVIAWAMECYEKGILTKDETDGLELNFGNGDAVNEVIKRIAYKNGYLGNLLARGVKEASEIVGCGSQYFAMHFKGLELAGHSPRGVKGWTLGYSVGWRGGSHHDGRVHDIEYPKTFEERALKYEDKPEIVYKTVHRVMIEESLITCRFFGGYYGPLEPNENHLRILKLTTGFDMTLEELWRTARRIRTLIRCIEVRDGFGRKDDVNAPPLRVLNEPIPEGPSKGAHAKPSEFKVMINRLYDLMGWDRETGKPKSEVLKELGLSDVTI
ncbi:MAG: aldehyde ferredoxin oxidoreductase family protein [Candidatus Bathyarchaeia archaeon]